MRFFVTQLIRPGSPGRILNHLVLCRIILEMALLLLFLDAFSIPLAFAEDPRKTVLPLLTRMESSYHRIDDYVAIFHKQERVEEKLLPEETILLKFQKPFKAYMKWIKDPHKDTEALYVEGKYDNKLVVHRGGVLGSLTLSLDPRGSLAMMNNRHPITEVGFGFLIQSMKRNIETALQLGEFEIIRLADEPFKGSPATVVEARFVPRGDGKYYTSRMIIHVDKELLLPTGAAFYDQNDVLFERYSYTEVRLNVGLTPLDFSRENKAYHF